jgi:hypothetical protein
MKFNYQADLKTLCNQEPKSNSNHNLKPAQMNFQQQSTIPIHSISCSESTFHKSPKNSLKPIVVSHLGRSSQEYNTTFEYPIRSIAKLFKAASMSSNNIVNAEE